MKKVVFVLRLLFVLLVMAGLVTASMMRSDALLFFLQDLGFGQQIMASLPSILFYIGLLIWLFTLERSWAKNSLIRLIVVSIYALLVLAFDMFTSFALKWQASGLNLFSFYFSLTQWGGLNSSYFIFKLFFYTLFVGGFITLTLLNVFSSMKHKPINFQFLIVLSLTLLLASFTVYGSKLRKDITANGLGYTLSSIDKTPREGDFSSLKSATKDAFTLDLQGVEAANAVIIVLESTRKDALDLYNKELNIETPFWNDLARQSYVFSGMYATIPSTIKALTSINCGVVPYLNFPILESIYGLPNDCLAESLKSYGYDSLFMQSATNDYGNITALAKEWGFDEFISADDLAQEGFKSNPFGYEDNILLEKSGEWLSEQSEPFIALYLTTGPHWPYNLYDEAAGLYVDTQLGESYTGTNEKYPLDGSAHLRPNYLKTIVHQDAFLRELIEQFKQTGHYDNTVFVFIADHGVVLGDRKQYLRANSMFQEVVNVPFMVHVPWQKTEAHVSDALLSQTDIPQIISNVLQAKNVLEDIINDKVFSSCWFWKWCIARVDQQYKYIHNFDSAQDELYDLQQDPKEQNNIINEHAERAVQYKQETLAWYQEQLAIYGQLYQQHDKQFYLQGHPVIEKSNNRSVP